MSESQPEFTFNPALYRKLCEPKTAEQANDDLQAFRGELRALREKYGVTDLSWVAGINILYPDGEEGRGMTFGHEGSVLECPAMMAYGYGQASEDQKENINKLAAGKAKRRPA